MIVWGVEFICILILFYAKGNAQNRLLLAIITYMFFLVVFRNYNLGMEDTQAVYLPAFYALDRMSFEEVIVTHGNKDPVFYILSWIFRLFSSNEQLYFALCAFPIMYATYTLIKKFSCNYAESIVLFLAVNGYCIVFTGMRHSLALAFVTLAFIYLMANKRIPAIILIAIASCFHITAIIALLLLFLKVFKMNFKINVLTFVFAVIFALWGSKVDVIQQMVLLYSIMSNEDSGRFDIYGQDQTILNLNAAIIGITLYTIAYWGLRKNNLLEKYRLAVNSLFVGCVLLCFTKILGEFLRLSSFYLVPAMFLVPLGLKGLKLPRVCHLLFVFTFFAYFFFSQAVHSNILNYKLF